MLQIPKEKHFLRLINYEHVYGIINGFDQLKMKFRITHYTLRKIITDKNSNRINARINNRQNFTTATDIVINNYSIINNNYNNLTDTNPILLLIDLSPSTFYFSPGAINDMYTAPSSFRDVEHGWKFFTALSKHVFAVLICIFILNSCKLLKKNYKKHDKIIRSHWDRFHKCLIISYARKCGRAQYSP